MCLEKRQVLLMGFQDPNTYVTPLQKKQQKKKNILGGYAPLTSLDPTWVLYGSTDPGYVNNKTKMKSYRGLRPGSRALHPPAKNSYEAYLKTAKYTTNTLKSLMSMRVTCW